MEATTTTTAFEGVTFNNAWAKTKTEAEFVEHEKHNHLTEDQLKEAYALITALPAEKEKAKKVK